MMHRRPERAPVRPEMLTADYWLSKRDDCDCVLLTAAEIEQVNREIAAECAELVSLENVESNCSGSWVRQRIERYRLPRGEQRFDSAGAEWTEERYRELEQRRNVDALPSNIVPCRGVVVRKTLVRGFPSSELLTKERGDFEFDRFQETELDTGEPLLILHESLDGAWMFVQASNYSGWLLREFVAEVTGLSDWQRLLSPRDFVVCVASALTTEGHSGTATFMMGSRLLVEKDRPGDVTVLVPRRRPSGEAWFESHRLKRNADVVRGYLPLTRRNLFMQIFKMLGEPYSWGGLVEGRDCTRLLFDTYRCFGIFLPRNSSQQKGIGVECLDLSRHPNESHAVWSDAISAITPGTPIYSDGHAMLYLGSEGGYHYIIHSASRLQNIPTHGAPNRFGVVVSAVSDLRGGLSSVRWARELRPRRANSEQ